MLGAVSMSVPETQISLAQARKTLVPVTIEAARKISVAMGAF